MPAASDTTEPLLFVLVGENGARAFGIDAATRARRLATNAGQLTLNDRPVTVLTITARRIDQ